MKQQSPTHSLKFSQIIQTEMISFYIGKFETTGFDGLIQAENPYFTQCHILKLAYNKHVQKINTLFSVVKYKNKQKVNERSFVLPFLCVMDELTTQIEYGDRRRETTIVSD